MKKTQKSEYLSGNGGIWEVLKIAMPLILAASTHAVNLYVDRAMLAQYDYDAMGASFASGLTNFTCTCLFMGLIGYTGTFVAQYAGANQPKRIGISVWQGIFMAIAGGVFMWTSILWAKPMFELFGHDKHLIPLEISYFKILSIGAIFMLIQNALSCFWSGRGKTAVVMGVSFFTMCINIPLNYLLIFGKFGFPELGIAGAAWGTVIACIAGCVTFFALFVSPRARRHFGTWGNFIDWELFRRMLRYGFPAGVHLFLDLAAFNVFAIILGRYGEAIQEATSIAFGINNISFTPILGVGQAICILVGQSIGAKDIPHAVKCVKSARSLLLVYTVCMTCLFVFGQEIVMAPFAKGGADEAESLKLAGTMLKFVAAYLLFDNIVILYSNAIRGAGDTKFAMYLICIAAWGGLGIPSIVIYMMGGSVWALWSLLVGYIVVLGICFYWRYYTGKWKNMRVIEDTLPSSPGENA